MPFCLTTQTNFIMMDYSYKVILFNHYRMVGVEIDVAVCSLVFVSVGVRINYVTHSMLS